jgi:lipoprotein-anchoring transpeptidase ErfK/SrfK
MRRSFKLASLGCAFGLCLLGLDLILQKQSQSTVTLPESFLGSLTESVQNVSNLELKPKNHRSNSHPKEKLSPAAAALTTPSSDERSQSLESDSTASAYAGTHLVIRLSRRQVSLYEGSLKVKTYPIAIGRAGWETPTGQFQVMDMRHNPTWINPQTDQVIPGGTPGNPLGSYWIGFWTDGRDWIGFHGTPDSNSVGTATSHGCLRMYNRDVEELFHQVSNGTPVIVMR